MRMGLLCMYHTALNCYRPSNIQRDERHLLGSIVKQMRDGIAVTDMDGRITFVNAAFAYLYEREADQLVGETIEQFFLPHQMDLWVVGLDRVRTTGQFEGMFEHVRTDKSQFTSSMIASLLRSPTDEPEGIIITARDATAQRQAAATECRTNSFQNAVESMEQVIGVIGHELRTPLAAIRLSSEVLQSSFCASGDDAGAISDLLNTMHDQSLHMSDMIHNMLEAVRLNSGHAKWHWSDIMLAKICTHTINAIRSTHKLDRVNLNCHLASDNLTMRGDGDTIERLLSNLITNAIRHTTEGYINVTLDEANKDDQRYIVMTIEDSGEGISADVIRQLGKPFALNCGLVGADSVRGAGLGLAICGGIITAHGGTIAVSSQIDQGTRIEVHLRADLDGPQLTNSKTICNSFPGKTR